MSNPLLTFTDLPPFSQIKPEHVKPAVEQVIEEYQLTENNTLIASNMLVLYGE